MRCGDTRCWLHSDAMLGGWVWMGMRVCGQLMVGTCEMQRRGKRFGASAAIDGLDAVDAWGGTKGARRSTGSAE